MKITFTPEEAQDYVIAAACAELGLKPEQWNCSIWVCPENGLQIELIKIEEDESEA